MACRFISIVIFFGIISWFKIIDVYHHYFFDSGAVVLCYNFFRLFFVVAITWIIYATGYLILRLAARQNSLVGLSVSERYLLGFSAGVGVWHIVMLLLGLLNLYYLAIMMLLCCIVLVFSSSHLKNIVGISVLHLRAWARSPRECCLSLAAPIAFLSVLIWLFIVAALYPAGGHDYFTHYFHYYSSVIKQHGLSPNDVWYHYYYSKGAGLHFLGMILTDSLSPSLMTFVCVMSASLALYSLTSRLSLRSLWPLFCAITYLSYYILPLNGNGGEFQKTHEEVSALIVITVWLLSISYMHKNFVRQSILFSLALVLISLVILTQAISVFLATYFSVMLVLSLISKNNRSTKEFFFFASLVSLCTVLMLALNYIATGLITDQEINIAWHFANVEKLKQWGVLPNVMLVAWIRDNYEAVALPWNVGDAWREILYYTRSYYLNFVLISTVIPLIFVLLFNISYKFRNNFVRYSAWAGVVCLLLIPSLVFYRNMNVPILTQVTNFFVASKSQLLLYKLLFATSFLFLIVRFTIKPVDDARSISSLNVYGEAKNKILLNLLIFIAVFVTLSTLFGHAQITSYYRFSGFFFPLMLLACAISWGYLSNTGTGLRLSASFFRFAVPAIVTIGMMMSWGDWINNVYQVTAPRIKYSVGQYSIAEAYQKQNSGFPFGGIHPGTWEAVQHVPHGERIWSTTVVSYCMAPDCHVESVISYKFSPRMSEILSGTAESAKSILQSEGLNYFLFLSEYPMLDYLPYSQLFKPENMVKLFTVKWTDNKTYLLTWRGEHDEPLSSGFLKAYSARLAEKEDQSFKFSQSIGHLKLFMDRIRVQERPLHPIDFPWQNYKG